eukprot:TRINITY_DN11510_c0_g1_i1.p1 TRINITY_DN11510_c0_g1~~TRINITY_DN11510_c0_g1_i1.p1  ORF type:complete len:665 (+),score=154.90 TRINITY_DN11510_c0_g1_i1:10-2004(+)
MEGAEEDKLDVDQSAAPVAQSDAAIELATHPKDDNNDNMDVDEHEEPEYEVETIKEMKLRRDQDGRQRLHFYVKWKGYPDSQSTWEPFENLDGSSELRDEYLKNYRERLAQGGSKPKSASKPVKQKEQRTQPHTKKKYDLSAFADEDEEMDQDQEALDRVEAQRREYQKRQKLNQSKSTSHSKRSDGPKKAARESKDAEAFEEDEGEAQPASNGLQDSTNDISEEIEAVPVASKKSKSKESAEENGEGTNQKAPKKSKKLTKEAHAMAKVAVDREAIKRVSDSYFGKLKNEWDVDRFDPEPPAARSTSTAASDDLISDVAPSVDDVAPVPRRLRWKMLQDASESHKKRKIHDTDENGSGASDVDIRHELAAQAQRKSLDSITKYLESLEIATDGTEAQLRRRWLASHLVSVDRHVDLDSHYMLGTMMEEIPQRKGSVVLDCEDDNNGRADSLSDLDQVKAAKKNPDAPILHIAIRVMPKMEYDGLAVLLRASIGKLISLRLHCSCLSLIDTELAQLLRGATALEVLELSSSLRPLTCRGLKMILSQCPQLRELNLSGQTLLSDESAQVIADYCPWLEVLILDTQFVSAQTMLNIALQCPFLRILHVNNANKITMKAVTLMVQFLPLLREFSAINSINSFEQARQDTFRRKFIALMKEKDIQGFL